MRLWAINGQRIVFMAIKTNNNKPHALLTVNSVNGNYTKITSENQNQKQTKKNMHDNKWCGH